MSGSEGADPRWLLIVGSGRSGTTLALRIASSLPNVVGPSVLSGAYPQAAGVAERLRQHSLLPARLRRASSESVGLLQRAGFDEAWKATTNLPASPEDCPAQAREILTTFARRLTSIHNADFICVKNTANCYRLVPLLAALPAAKVLHVVRHPLEVARSLQRVEFWPSLQLWWCDETPTQRAARGIAPLETALEHWARQVDALDDARQSAPASVTWATARYEELMADPVPTVHDLFSSLLGVNLHENAAADAVEANDVRRRRARLEPQAGSLDGIRCAVYVSEIASRHGYVLT